MVPFSPLSTLAFSIGKNFGIALLSAKKNQQTHAHNDSIEKMYLKVKISELKMQIFRGKKEKWKLSAKDVLVKVMQCYLYHVFN